MIVVDARSGDEVRVGDTIRYRDGSWWTLLRVKRGILSAKALIEGNSIAHDPDLDRSLTNAARSWVRMPIRYTHPDFLLKAVAFMPS